MKFKAIKFERVASIISFLFVFSFFLTNIYLAFHVDSTHVIMPYARYIIPAIHGICSVLTFILIFKFYYPVLFTVFQMESILCILANFETLGIFFYFISIFLIFVIYYQTKPVKYIVVLTYILHWCAIAFTYQRGWKYLLINTFSSVYMLILFLWLYNLLKVRFSCFKPSMIMQNSTIGDKIPGTTLSLSEFSLTERQINFVLEYINNNLSYNDLSEKYYVSLSTVKKEFADVFKVFGVTKNEELKMLLMQYVIIK